MNIYILAGAFALMVVLLCKKPLLVFLKLITNAVLGMGLIFAINSVFPSSVGYNWFNISVSALLGIPGSILICLVGKLL